MATNGAQKYLDELAMRNQVKRQQRLEEESRVAGMRARERGFNAYTCGANNGKREKSVGKGRSRSRPKSVNVDEGGSPGMRRGWSHRPQYIPPNREKVVKTDKKTFEYSEDFEDSSQFVTEKGQTSGQSGFLVKEEVHDIQDTLLQSSRNRSGTRHLTDDSPYSLHNDSFDAVIAAVSGANAQFHEDIEIEEEDDDRGNEDDYQADDLNNSVDSLDGLDHSAVRSDMHVDSKIVVPMLKIDIPTKPVASAYTSRSRKEIHYNALSTKNDDQLVPTPRERRASAHGARVDAAGYDNNNTIHPPLSSSSSSRYTPRLKTSMITAFNMDSVSKDKELYVKEVSKDSTTTNAITKDSSMKAGTRISPVKPLGIRPVTQSRWVRPASAGKYLDAHTYTLHGTDLHRQNSHHSSSSSSSTSGREGDYSITSSEHRHRHSLQSNTLSEQDMTSIKATPVTVLPVALPKRNSNSSEISLLTKVTTLPLKRPLSTKASSLGGSWECDH